MICCEEPMVCCEVPEEVTMTGDIVVGDGSFCYVAILEGEWTPEQIRAAFADGYDWYGTDRITLTIIDPARNGEVALPMEAGEYYGRYPHPVEWR